MPRFRGSLCSFALLCAVSSAAAQGTSPVALAPTGGERTCDETALRALAAEPGRVAREGGRVSLVPPASMREAESRPLFTQGFTPALLMTDDSSDATLLVAFAGEVAHVDHRPYQDRRRHAAEGGTPRWVRWIERQVVDLGGGVRAYRIEYLKRRSHEVQLFAPFQGRTLVVFVINPGDDPVVQTKINESLASLVVHDCALPPGAPASAAAASAAAAGAARDGGGVDAVCEEPELQAHLAAGDPRREAIADGRISLVPPEGMEELTSIEVSGWRTQPVRVFADNRGMVWFRYVNGVADVGSPAFQAVMEQWVGGERPERIHWISREVVEQGGARWLRLEYTYRWRRSRAHYEVETLAIVYLTGFQGRILAVGFSGPRDAREALARSAATLDVRDCRVSRPLWAWVDSAAVARAAAALEAPQMPANMKPVFRVTFDTAGAVETVEPVFAQTPAPYADAVVAALRAAVKPKPRSRYPTAHLVRVVGGATPLVDSPELLERLPEVRDREWIEQRLGELSNMLMFRPGTSRRAAPGFYVRMRVLPDGKVDLASVQLLRGSGVEWLDEDILKIARRTAFHPGEVDGFAARTWVLLPMSLFYH